MINNEEIARVKSIHKQELLELRQAHSEVVDKYEKLRSTSEKLSKQLHMKNDENLDLLKQNKFMENKIRLMENNGDSGSIRGSLNLKKSSSNMPPPLFGNLKMEDEPGEEFDNACLADLKNGRMPGDDYAGRSSLALSEIQRRNSQWQPHMRSAYPSVFTDIDAGEDEIRDGIPLGANDSHMSLLSTGQGKGKKIGGKTAYHRPGPPTPSKNAGRLSFGPEDQGGRLSGVMPNADPKGPKFKLFGTNKIKDESPCMDLATIMRRPITTVPQPPVPAIEDLRHVTKRRQKDFNANHPEFYEIATTDDYTKYRDNSRYSSMESGEDDNESTCGEADFSILEKPMMAQGAPDESFNAAELNTPDSTSCCPILTRRRSFDNKTNKRLSREDFKRKSKDKRTANFNTVRSKTTTNGGASSSNTSTASSNDSLLPGQHGQHQSSNQNNCNNNNFLTKASDNNLDEVFQDFESLINTKISEKFDTNNEDNNNAKDDKLHGSWDFPLKTSSSNYEEFFKRDKRVDTAPISINSRLPQLSRPSEMFLVNNGNDRIVPYINQQMPKTRSETMPKNTSLKSSLLILIFILLLYIFYYFVIR